MKLIFQVSLLSKCILINIIIISFLVFFDSSSLYFDQVNFEKENGKIIFWSQKNFTNSFFFFLI